MNYEIRFFDGWDDGIPSYYMIYKDGKLWCPFSFDTVLDVIKEIENVDPQAAKELYQIESSIG